MFKGLIPAIFILGAVCSATIFAFIWLISGGGFSIESDVPISPDLEIRIENGVADTIYIYREQ